MSHSSMIRYYWEPTRKTKILISIPIAVISIIGCLCIIFGPVQHELGSIACSSLFGCTAEEFFDQEFEFYKETGDFRKSARINRKGELVIYLTNKQAKIWMESDWFDILYDAECHPNIEVSPDLKVITVYTSKDMDKNSLNEMRDVFNSILMRIHFINGINGSKEKVLCIEKSIKTGEELDRQYWAWGDLMGYY